MVLDVMSIAVVSVATTLINVAFNTFYKSKCNKFSCCWEFLSFNRNIDIEEELDYTLILRRTLSDASFVSVVSKRNGSSVCGDNDNSVLGVDASFVEFKHQLNNKKIKFNNVMPFLDEIEKKLSSHNSGSNKSD